ncbi:hypothetical protein [Roseospirillum parvum]|uniref:DUF4136 domain-containing protein n=1 Tax=Roseospirillum parvum TaxID=83401 RepID=A0A1G8B643_9PROT|nr:hypothetical protein [Roseospirillum parvum]SDH28615.1 hypothetical protein SAMN05421742_105234 [Roseospirillum parvum]
MRSPRRSRAVLLTAALLAAPLALSAGPAPAQDALTSDVTLSAMAFQPVPQGAPIAVRLYDDSQAGLALKQAFEQQLKLSGYRVVPDDGQATLVLAFEVTDSGNAAPEENDGMLRLQGRAGGGYDDGQLRADLNLFSSSDSSVFGGRPRDGKPTPVPDSSMRFEVGVTDLANGRRLWQGWANAATHGRNPTELARQLVRPMVAKIGQTVHAETGTLTVGD